MHACRLTDGDTTTRRVVPPSGGGSLEPTWIGFRRRGRQVGRLADSAATSQTSDVGGPGPAVREGSDTIFAGKQPKARAEGSSGASTYWTLTTAMTGVMV